MSGAKLGRGHVGADPVVAARGGAKLGRGHVDAGR